MQYFLDSLRMLTTLSLFLFIIIAVNDGIMGDAFSEGKVFYEEGSCFKTTCNCPEGYALMCKNTPPYCYPCKMADQQSNVCKKESEPDSIPCN